MTDFNASDRDVTRAIRSWLHEDRHEDVSRIAAAVLDRVEATPRRRARWWPARRSSDMNNFAKVLVATAAVVAVAVVGINLLPGSESGAGGVPPPASPSAPSPVPALVVRLRTRRVARDRRGHAVRRAAFTTRMPVGDTIDPDVHRARRRGRRIADPAPVSFAGSSRPRSRAPGHRRDRLPVPRRHDPQGRSVPTGRTRTPTSLSGRRSDDLVQALQEQTALRVPPIRST